MFQCNFIRASSIYSSNISDNFEKEGETYQQQAKIDDVVKSFGGYPAIQHTAYQRAEDHNGEAQCGIIKNGLGKQTC